jgi:hypothetical protein
VRAGALLALLAALSMPVCAVLCGLVPPRLTVARAVHVRCEPVPLTLLLLICDSFVCCCRWFTVNAGGGMRAWLASGWIADGVPTIEALLMLSQLAG